MKRAVDGRRGVLSLCNREREHEIDGIFIAISFDCSHLCRNIIKIITNTITMKGRGVAE